MNNAIRFVVRYGGEEKRLFSVRELPSGHLTFLPPSLSSRIQGKNERIRDTHLTAHTRSQVDGIVKGMHHIKESVLTEDHRYFSRSIFIKADEKTRFRWPMLFLCGQSLRDYTPRNSDTIGDNVIRLFAYDHTSTLCFSVCAGESDIYWPHIQGFNKFEKSFTELSLAIYFCFYRQPSASVMAGHLAAGSKWREQGEAISETVIRSPVPEDGLEKYVQDNVIRALHTYTKAIMQMVGRRDEISQMAINRNGFSRWPMFQSLREMNYGSFSRLTNKIEISPLDLDGRKKSRAEIQEYMLREKHIIIDLIRSCPRSVLIELATNNDIIAEYRQEVRRVLNLRATDHKD